VNGHAEHAAVSQNLEKLANLIYGLPLDSVEVPIENVNTEFPDLEAAEVENLIQQMRDAGLLRISLAGDVIRLNAAGKLAHSNGSTCEVVLGAQFIGTKYRCAVVHIIVETENGDESGGSGFFVAEPVNRIVTASHLFEERQLLRVEDIGGNVIANDAAEVRLAPGRIDLATIRCDTPGGVTPFRVDWRDDPIQSLTMFSCLVSPHLQVTTWRWLAPARK